MSNISKNFMKTESKTPASSRKDKSITINLADDFLEVRGFGQCIPISLAKKMAKNYWETYDEIINLLDFINENKGGLLDPIKKDKVRNNQLNKLKMMMNPSNHIVSGVFGKEIILQILSQKDCEGIRYIVGRDDDDKMTIILVGVKETNYANEEENFTIKNYKEEKIKIRKAEILPNSHYYKNVKENQSSDPNDPNNGEVHACSLTVKELKDLLNEKFQNMVEDVNQILFGEF